MPENNSRLEALQNLIDEGADEIDTALLSWAAYKISGPELLARLDRIIESEEVALLQRAEEPESLDGEGPWEHG